jgi:hypothetical protein
MEMGARLIDAEQRLAELPDLERELALAEAEIAKLKGDVAYLESTLGEVLASPSWRLTAPLRGLRTRLASRRRG